MRTIALWVTFRVLSLESLGYHKDAGLSLGAPELRYQRKRGLGIKRGEETENVERE